jgi:hypothetical protein
MTLRKLKLVCERLFKVPASQQSVGVLAANPPDKPPMGLSAADDDQTLASLDVQVCHAEHVKASMLLACHFTPCHRLAHVPSG